jgi:hypothetical protein
MAPIKRYTVKVGGGKLYTDFIGTIEMRVDSVSLLLENILYIPSLDINLLSSRKLYLDWKYLDIFNNKSI